MTEFMQLLSARVSALDAPLIAQLAVIVIALFLFYRFLHRRRAFSILLGVLGVYLLHIFTGYAKLDIIHSFTGLFVEHGVLILVLIFSPELRATLERIGASFSLQGFRKRPKSPSTLVSALKKALLDMSDTGTGAIIFFEKKVNLEDVANSGHRVDALITSEILLTIFFSGTPLHDGAVMIRNGKIYAASCFIRGDASSKLPSQYGSRHQAAFNLSLSSDAITIVVSEEDGSISYTERGEIFHDISPETLERVLYRALGLKRSRRAQKEDAALPPLTPDYAIPAPAPAPAPAVEEAPRATVNVQHKTDAVAIPADDDGDDE
ncbi:MAG: diadenylate cyclase [Clostridia bacterium]|nr:diadenylate cyclase [Clostridia bacterium]